MNWDEAFADRYDTWAADMTADVPFYVELAREADGPIVELAVGTGRVAIPVARATGRRVIGLDASPAMLRQARRNAAAVGDDRIDLILDGGATSSLWWASKNEWLGLIDMAGLELEALHGGFAGEPLADDSTEYVFVARRPR